jgi:peptide subunit release factor 1 (eRF1)
LNTTLITEDIEVLKAMNASQAETIDMLRQELRDLREINICLCKGNVDRLKDELDEMLAEAKADVLTVLAEIEAARVKIRCPEKCIDVEEDGHG